MMFLLEPLLFLANGVLCLVAQGNIRAQCMAESQAQEEMVRTQSLHPPSVCEWSVAVVSNRQITCGDYA
jgi:hypothetical protein